MRKFAAYIWICRYIHTIHEFLIDFLCERLLESNRLDVIICGGSGFMGKRVVEAAVTHLKNHTWGVSGRCRTKMQTQLEQLGERLNSDFISSDIPVFVINMDQQASLRAMTMRCRVLINCLGPYELHGERLVLACLETDTHYLDLSVETHFSELMQAKYQGMARCKGVYIVSGCSSHSLITDLGIIHMQDLFGGTINSVEAYSEYGKEGPNPPVIGHAGLWNCIVLALANIRGIPEIRRKIHPRTYPPLHPIATYSLEKLMAAFSFTSNINIPVPVVVQQVVERTQYHSYDHDKNRPIQFQNYVLFPSVFNAVIFVIWLIGIGILAQLQCTRNLLMRYPRVFTFFLFSSDGPDIEDMEKLDYHITLNGLGWPVVGKKANHEFREAPDKKFTLTVDGINPIYGASCDCILACATTLLTQCHRLPSYGGVYTPGVAFGKTNIIETLNQLGIVYNIVTPK